MSKDIEDGKDMEELDESVEEESNDSEEQSSSSEDLASVVEKQKEEIERLKGHLRNKEEKKGETTGLPDEDRELLKKTSEHLGKMMEASKDEALKKIKRTDWGSLYTEENDPEGERTAKLSTALKVVESQFGKSITVEEYERNLRKAHLLISDEEESAKAEQSQTIEAMKREAGSTGSTYRSSSEGQVFTPAEQRSLERTKIYTESIKPPHLKVKK